MYKIRNELEMNQLLSKVKVYYTDCSAVTEGKVEGRKAGKLSSKLVK